ncbi:MAG: tRNA (adenosine(37)-N6)-threonylcarbamoyltransferase complex ATPase subunit type 1 TsaE [Candidatus Eremiobacteraeota bacterium]|nr:tRNA (adenosine(37)-N6)-threonylcarbamoyltransferase complex ATPase subunit type 1 TsaE [Candidatus Eremiobacteraeota bacterium]
MPDACSAPIRRTFANEAAFTAFAADFSRRLRPGDVVALGGPLGSGKTTFARAIVRALHGSDQGSSPTFTFWHRYEGCPLIDHLDFYRIRDSNEIVELGLDDAFDGTSIVLVEWWENAPDIVGDRQYEIRIDGAGDSPRCVECVARP